MLRSILVFAPVFRYFDVFDKVDDFGFWHGLPKVDLWRSALAHRPSTIAAVGTDYPERLRRFLVARGSALTRRLDASPG